MSDSFRSSLADSDDLKNLEKMGEAVHQKIRTVHTADPNVLLQIVADYEERVQEILGTLFHGPIQPKVSDQVREWIDRLNKGQESQACLPHIEDLLDECVKHYREILEQKIIIVNMRIFRPKDQTIVPSDDPKAREIEPQRSGQKLQVFYSILLNRKIAQSDVVHYRETLEEEQMRVFPYHIFYLKEPRCTVCISDQIGEKTYVYKGEWIAPQALACMQKREVIDGVEPTGVTFGIDYAKRLEEAIFIESIDDVPSEIVTRTKTSDTDESLDEEKLRYHTELLEARDVLEETGVEFLEDGSVYCGRMKRSNVWSRINGKTISSYASAGFLKRYGIITKKQGSITSPRQFAHLLDVLGFTVIKEGSTNEKRMFKKEIEENKSVLEETGVEFLEDGSVYCGRMNLVKDWPDVRGKNMSSYPSAKFLRRNGIVEKGSCQMRNGKQFVQLLYVLGFTVVFEESNEEKAMFKKEVEENKNVLQAAGIECLKDGSVYCRTIKGKTDWLKIEGKGMSSYPSAKFLRKNGIIEAHQAKMSNQQQFVHLLRVLGFTVIEENSQAEKQILKKELEENQVVLIDTGVEFLEGGRIYCGRMQGGFRNWGKIYKKPLYSYPYTEFLRKNGIIEAHQNHMTNRQQFAHLLQVLGFTVLDSLPTPPSSSSDSSPLYPEEGHQ